MWIWGYHADIMGYNMGITMRSLEIPNTEGDLAGSESILCIYCIWLRLNMGKAQSSGNGHISCSLESDLLKTTFQESPIENVSIVGL